MSLRVKLFAAFLGLIIVPLILLGLAGYRLVTGMIEEKYSEQTELTLRALGQSVNFVFREMNKVTDSTIAADALQEALNNRGYDGRDITGIDYLELNEVQRNFRELLVNHPSISYALLYTLHDGRINTLFVKETFAAMPFEQFSRHELYHRVMERQGLPLWVGPYEYPELTGAEPVFTQIRVVKDIATLQDKGILLVQIKNSGLEELFRYFRYKQEQTETQFLIVNGQGLVLYDSGGEWNGARIGDALSEPLVLDGAYHSKRNTFGGRDSIVSGVGLEHENWHLVSATSWDSLSSEVLLYSRWLAAVLFFCLLSAFLFILFFANRVARSIIRTVALMRRVERGDLSARLPVAGDDETALLARGFNSLVHRVEELLEEVKREQERKTRAEMAALQAQIKPHFLFNALESINVLAVQNQGAKVSRMVAKLGNLLRISIQSREEIAVEQELEHLASFLEIQKFRFADLFDYEIDVPAGLFPCKMQKLTLQPLVENSIQHGFEGIAYRGIVRVRAEEENGRIAFYVEDNGVGMTPAQLEALASAPEPEVAYGDSPDYGERRGLGVRNVAERIRLRYGDRGRLLVCSAPGFGTVIKLVIPKERGRESV